MEGSDLNYYFNWIKTQLSSQVKSYFYLNITLTLETLFQEYEYAQTRGVFSFSKKKTKILLCCF